MKQYTIAEILHYAADKKLANKEEQYWARGGNKERFSCCAVEEAVFSVYNSDSIERDALIRRILSGLFAMGCPIDSTDAFGEEDRFSAEKQQARYGWLKFAAIMAEEQGV